MVSEGGDGVGVEVEVGSRAGNGMPFELTDAPEAIGQVPGAPPSPYTSFLKGRKLSAPFRSLEQIPFFWIMRIVSGDASS